MVTTGPPAVEAHRWCVNVRDPAPLHKSYIRSSVEHPGERFDHMGRSGQTTWTTLTLPKPAAIVLPFRPFESLQRCAVPIRRSPTMSRAVRMLALLFVLALALPGTAFAGTTY